MALTEIEEKALVLLGVMQERDEVYRDMNHRIAEVMGEFPTYVEHLDAPIGAALDVLFEAVFGSDIASYYVHECAGPRGHGGGIECCPASKAKPWKLTCIADLRAYLEHARVCPGMQGTASAGPEAAEA